MKAKCRSVYAFRQVWRFMQESRGRFNPWEPLRPLPTMLWPSRFRAVLTRRNLAPAKPHGTLPHRPAATRVVWIARHTVHTTNSASVPLTIHEKTTAAKLSGLIPPSVHNMGALVKSCGTWSPGRCPQHGVRPLSVGGFGCQEGARDET